MVSCSSGEIGSLQLECFRNSEKGQEGPEAVSVRTVEEVCDHGHLQVGLSKLVKYYCVI